MGKIFVRVKLEYEYQTTLGFSYLQSKFSNPLSKYPNFPR